METLVRLLQRKIPARVQANRVTEIRTAMQLAEEYGFQLVVDGGASAYEMAAELAARALPSFCHPRRTPTSREKKLPIGATISILHHGRRPFSVPPA